ncbi:SMF family protein [Nitrosococcus halophilus Nc 4]|uniref:SMF family protein n=1 Tax=Nitrosococcus halophilus (strain Nc4) TaxID=472759 RepID=D5BV40_NITHN|nr:DNA-processing protein DprA [Nitrosococcus halophilus]ADE15390.1 SMF family protein [Nitrosococcus halophilus Nc 4]
MNFTENALNVMTARTYKGIGRAWIAKNLSTVKSDVEIVSLLSSSGKVKSAISIEEFRRKRSVLQKILLDSAGSVDGVIALGDKDFPQHRGIVKNSEKPIFLFYRGDLSLLTENSKNIAVIGLLTPDEDIESEEKEVVAELVRSGAVIVSGLAFGCDSIAHRQALDCDGLTIAILPSPLNDVIPARNRALAGEIVEKGGLLISEYLTVAKSKMEMSARYQERDRLQALFSNSIILSASYAKNNLGNDSGSRLAMGYAKDYSIPRVVIYDMEKYVENPMFDLNRQIMREEPDVIVINSQNKALVVDRIMRLRPPRADAPSIQPRMI